MMAICTVRSARPVDLPHVRRLLEGRSGHNVDPAMLVSVPGQRHVLVLDAPTGGLAAIAVVAIDPPDAHLEVLAMEPCYSSRELETRMHAVAEALAEAFECHALDIPGARAA
jgi:hypothetical protein